MAKRYGATKVFVPISAVMKGESNGAPTDYYNTRLAAQKRKQQLVSYDQPSQSIAYNKRMEQLQEPNEMDKPHGHRAVYSSPNVNMEQKQEKILPGYPKRVVRHDYEPMPGPGPSFMSHNNSDTVQEQPISSVSYHTPALEDENPYNLETGSMIEFSNPPKYGVIKWIGHLADIPKKCKIAGVELVNPMLVEYHLIMLLSDCMQSVAIYI